MYAAARDLRIAVKGVITQRKLELSELVEINLPEFLPGIVLSYKLYKDHTRDEELAELNDVLHPGFMPAGDVMVEEN
jgi:prophage DNA circulation protein